MKKHRLLYLPIAFIFMLSFVDCAKRGRPNGGLKDSIPPVIVKSNPENFSTNFKGDEIRIYFDEYIKFQDLNKQLIISPPLDYAPTITPLSTSKYIKIKILDTLRENTTYSINFGKSILDNNEGNEYDYYKYVFSTGDYIDSLKVKGTIKDSKLITLESPISVMLYEVTEEYNDSLIYSEKPMYITTVKDSTDTFELSNLKEGTYKLIALKEDNSDYIFQSDKDKIGFLNEIITLPTDSLYILTLFKETLEYNMSRPKHESKNHILFGYEGNADSLQLELITPVVSDFTFKQFKDRQRDSIHYWFKPDLEIDTLQFIARNLSEIDTLTVKLRDLYKDSLKVTVESKPFLKLKDSVKIFSNTPLVDVNAEFISIIDKDSISIPVSAILQPKDYTAALIFEKTESQTYNVTIFPGAFTDFYEAVNDTINYRGSTKAISDYGSLTMNLENVKSYPIIVELVDQNYKLIEKEYITETKEIAFTTLIPGKYYVRIIYDENKNGLWDTGSFLENKQPETIIYYPSILDVRGNWDLVETFNLK
ncbi:MAG: hypothetical protein ACI9SJ_000766 [Flavobacteriaceae bacterium]|jgi:uncharacterized protein (DUF2141 family)